MTLGSSLVVGVMTQPLCAPDTALGGARIERGFKCARERLGAPAVAAIGLGMVSRTSDDVGIKHVLSNPLSVRGYLSGRARSSNCRRVRSNARELIGVRTD